MSLRLQKPHEIKVKGQKRYVTSVPTYRLKEGDHPPIYIQRGHLFAEGGQEIAIKDAPDWFWDEYAKIPAETRHELGVSLPTGKGSK